MIAAMSDWTPEGWVAFMTAIAGMVIGVIKALTTGTIKIIAALKKIETAAKESIPPEQLDELADRVAKKMRSSPHVTTLTLPKD